MVTGIARSLVGEPSGFLHTRFVVNTVSDLWQHIQTKKHYMRDGVQRLDGVQGDDVGTGEALFPTI